jgi:protein-L-isoaspartate(D-aspartate) O-methyltransferase
VLRPWRPSPRHRFVDTALANQAYEDTSLPIGHGQTISKPSVVARMLALLFEGAAPRRRAPGRVLEVGTGCGYQTALLLGWRRRVLSIERLRGAAPTRRRNNLSACRGDVRLVHGDGRVGHPPWAPYDSIIAAAGGDALPPAWLEQLAIGGRLVAPMHDNDSGGQVLVVVDRDEAGWRTRRCDAVHFVPLKSGRRMSCTSAAVPAASNAMQCMNPTRSRR